MDIYLTNPTEDIKISYKVIWLILWKVHKMTQDNFLKFDSVKKIQLVLRNNIVWGQVKHALQMDILS
jgi:hypothetical protein